MSVYTKSSAADSKRKTLTNDCLNWQQLSDENMTDGQTVEQVLHIGATTRWRLERSGDLIGYKFGKSKRYRVGDVRALVERAKVAA